MKRLREEPLHHLDFPKLKTIKVIRSILPTLWKKTRVKSLAALHGREKLISFFIRPFLVFPNSCTRFHVSHARMKFISLEIKTFITTSFARWCSPKTYASATRLSTLLISSLFLFFLLGDGSFPGLWSSGSLAHSSLHRYTYSSSPFSPALLLSFTSFIRSVSTRVWKGFHFSPFITRGIHKVRVPTFFFLHHLSCMMVISLSPSCAACISAWCAP